MSNSTVILYNNGGHEVLKRVSVRKAMNMLWRGVARVLETEEGVMFGPFERPKSIELMKYIYAKWHYNKSGEVLCSRRGVLKRDQYQCAYCGKAATTIDHIQPRSKGGTDSWLNLVAACQPCNHKKAAKSLKESHMKLLFEPRIPSFDEVFSWRKE